MSDEFKPGQRVEIQDRDRDPDRYPQATIVRAATRQEMFGNHDIFGDQRHDRGYVVRHDDGREEWAQEYNVLAMRNLDSRIVAAAVKALQKAGWGKFHGVYLNESILTEIARIVLRAAERPQGPLPYAAELAAYEVAVERARGCTEICRDCPELVEAAALRLAETLSKAHRIQS